MFTNSHSLIIEWGDCDPAGIVFYPRYFVMFDAATALLMEKASGMTRAQTIRHYGVISWPIVETRASFRAPARYDDTVRIDSRIARLGRSSFNVEHMLWREDRLCIEAAETRVWAAARDDQIQAVPIPDELSSVMTNGSDDGAAR